MFSTGRWNYSLGHCAPSYVHDPQFRSHWRTFGRGVVFQKKMPQDECELDCLGHRSYFTTDVIFFFCWWNNTVIEKWVSFLVLLLNLLQISFKVERNHYLPFPSKMFSLRDKFNVPMLTANLPYVHSFSLFSYSNWLMRDIIHFLSFILCYHRKEIMFSN